MPTKLRLPAVFCCLCVALAALLVHPYLEMSVNDDWSYTRTAQVLAQTGHIVYNGWAVEILGWQLLPAVLFIKLFGFSFTAVRLSMLPIAMLTTFLVQRVFVRCGLNEWNASVATLTLVFTPLFLPLSMTYMTDIPGLFIIVLCFYACLRAVQATTDWAAIAWICFAIVSNAVGGMARQIAWLGVLVMAPSTLWLLRRRPRMLAIGIPVLLAGVVFLFGAMHWFSLQPFSVPESILTGRFDVARFVWLLTHLCYAALELPLFLLPVLLPFTPAIWRGGRVVAIAFAAGVAALLIFLAYLHFYAHRQGFFFAILEPYLINCFSVSGVIDVSAIRGTRPVILTIPVRLVLTAVTFTGADAFLLAYLTGWRPLSAPAPSAEGTAPARLSWYELGVLLLPFTLAYIVLLCPRASVGDGVYDRYLLALILGALLVLARLYQERVSPTLPLLSVAVLAIVAVFSVAATHDYFAMSRARLAAAEELRSAGVPRTAIDAGFEYNSWTQVNQGGHLNDYRIVNPPGLYRPTTVYAEDDHCHPARPDLLPDIAARFALSYEPDLCGGPAGFAPVFYRNWLGPRGTAIYVVKYLR